LGVPTPTCSAPCAPPREGRYEPHRYLQPRDVADTIRSIIAAPAAAPIFDLLIRPPMPAT
jgi:NADP-dependent 3-hydroxy acid dehydrogenase YdfG